VNSGQLYSLLIEGIRTGTTGPNLFKYVVFALRKQDAASPATAATGAAPVTAATAAATPLVSNTTPPPGTTVAPGTSDTTQEQP